MKVMHFSHSLLEREIEGRDFHVDDSLFLQEGYKLCCVHHSGFVLTVFCRIFQHGRIYFVVRSLMS